VKAVYYQESGRFTIGCGEIRQRGYRELRVVSGARSGEQVAATLDRFAIVVPDET
jgi:hypothetical protein